MGVMGGVDDSDLSGYAVASTSLPGHYVMCDAGTLFAGISKVLSSHTASLVLGGVDDELQFLRENIHAYLISHAHLIMLQVLLSIL